MGLNITCYRARGQIVIPLIAKTDILHSLNIAHLPSLCLLLWNNEPYHTPRAVGVESETKSE